MLTRRQHIRLNDNNPSLLPLLDSLLFMPSQQMLPPLLPDILKLLIRMSVNRTKVVTNNGTSLIVREGRRVMVIVGSRGLGMRGRVEVDGDGVLHHGGGGGEGGSEEEQGGGGEPHLGRGCEL